MLIIYKKKGYDESLKLTAKQKLNAKRIFEVSDMKGLTMKHLQNYRRTDKNILGENIIESENSL